MRSPTILLASGLVLVGCVITACSAPELRRRPSSSSCKASDDDCPGASSKSRTDSSDDELGLPEAALAEDQEEPPREALAATDERTSDAGTTTTSSDGGAATVKPALNETNACWAGTLNAFVEKNGCYQRKSDAMWFQCGFDTASQKNAWFRNVVDGVGRFGTCSSLHPLK